MNRQQLQIIQLCQRINEYLRINIQPFPFKLLKSKKWYLQILKILFPYLTQKLTNIQQIQQDQKAIDQFLKLLVKEDIIQEDFLDIKGINIVSGDYQSIDYIVQLLNALVGRQLGNQEDQDQQKKSNFQTQSNKNLKQPNFYLLESHSDKQQKDKQCKSVLGINHQFQQDQQSQKHTYNKNQKKINKDIKINNIVPNAQLINSYPPPQKTFDQQSQEYLHKKIAKNIHEKKILTHQKNVKKLKKLVSHPTLKKQYRKALNPQAKQLTNIVTTEIKKKKKPTEINNNQKTVKLNIDKINRKKRQFDYYSKQYQHSKKIDKMIKDKQRQKIQQNNRKFEKILNWRQDKMKKQKQQFEKAIQMKINIQKQQYVKKINKLIIDLEKKKQIQQHKNFRQNLIKQNQQAARRMTSLQQWYQDRIKILKQNKQKKRSQRYFMHSGHKQIIKQIQKDLKRENQQKMIELTIKYRKHSAQIENDLEQLTDKIIKVYKKY